MITWTLGTDQSPKAGLLCHFKSPSKVNSAALTPLTLQKKEVEVHAQKAHTARCALKAVMAGEAHGGILANCSTAAGNGLNPCVSQG